MPNTKKKLFVLLVAVDKYQTSVKIMPKCTFGPLGGCVNDAQDMLDYLGVAEGFDLDVVFLKDEKATKEAVIDAFENHLGQAKEGDVALFYYSGHGIQEHADTIIWSEETDKKLECLVCYNEVDKPCLLADKELRYLLKQVASGTKESPKAAAPHILTIFDCCHSGTNTRNGYVTKPDILERQIKCIAPKRNWTDFFFNEKITKVSLENQPLSEALPEAIHLHLSACESDESALEVGGHGVFTTHLLKVLKQSRGDISYFDLMSQVRQYLRHTFKQKPQLLVTGEENQGIYDTFLGKPATAKSLYGNVIYNTDKGWTFDMGSLLGVQLKMRKIEVFDSKTEKKYVGRIQRIRLDETHLVFRGPDQPDTNKSYRGHVKGLMAHRIKVFVNNYNGIATKLPAIFDDMQEFGQNMVLEADESLADYTLQIRDGHYYITQPNDVFRPLTEPVSYCNSAAAKTMVYQLQHISHWEYVRRLRNENSYLFDTPPLLIEAFDGGKNGAKIDLSENIADLNPKRRVDGKYKGRVAVKLTNTSAQKLYISVLYLAPEFMVYLKGLDPIEYTLDPAESVWVFNGRKGEIGFSHQEITEDYNWVFRDNFLKIIVSTNVFDVSRLEKEGLPEALSKKEPLRGMEKGGLDLEEDVPKIPGDDWTTQNITLRIHNPTYNAVTVDDLMIMLQSEMARYALGIYANVAVNENGSRYFQLKPDIELIEEKHQRTDKISIEKLLVSEDKAIRLHTFKKHRREFQERMPLITVGDSWLHDGEVRSLAAHFMGQFTVCEMPTAIAKVIENGELKKVLSSLSTKQLLISEGFIALTTANPANYQTTVDTIINRLKSTLAVIQNQFPAMQIWLHGYDYFDSDIKKYGQIIDLFNEKLDKMVDSFEQISYIDLRGSLKQEQWQGGFLPNEDGFEVLAGRFFENLLD